MFHGKQKVKAKSQKKLKAGKLQKLLPPLFITIFAIIVLRNAWVTEDAYITFRTIDNFVNGYGLTWNTIERVQAYTHPLWMFLMTFLHLLTGEFFLTVIFLSFVLSVAMAIWLTYRIARTTAAAVLALLILILSKAFIDYSISGLENPLTHLFLVLFVYVYIKDKLNPGALFNLSLIAALSVCNRMDTILFYAPALGYALWRVRSGKAFWAFVAGFIPFMLWEAFSLFYYGLPLPNTFYAKLNTGIAKLDLFRQGGHYFVDSFAMDPITLLAILSGITIPFILKDWKKWPIVLGSFSYLIYVVYIGGDFMSGRFFAAPLLCSAVLIADTNLSYRGKKWILPYAGVLVVGLISPLCPVYTSADYGGDPDSRIIHKTGITDERAHYFCGSSLFNYRSDVEMPNHRWAEQGRELRKRGTVMAKTVTIGYFGYCAGPKVHVFDAQALSDPLLARLPIPNPKDWRIGHFRREFPNGYMQSVHYGTNLIEDKNLAAYYDKLKIITQGDLFSMERLKETVKLNLGFYDHLVEDFDPSPQP